MKYIVSVSHIDTCLSCYLQDHHNRDGEMLLGVAVDGLNTYEDVKRDLLHEYHVADFYPDPADVDSLDAAIMAEIESEFSAADKASLFDDSLDVPPSENLRAYADEVDPAGKTVDEILDALEASRDEAMRDWENAETCYAWFLITYEEDSAGD